MRALKSALILASVSWLLGGLSACGPGIKSYEAASLLMHSDDERFVELAPGEEAAPGQTDDERLEALGATLPSPATVLWVDDDGKQAAQLGITGTIYKNSATKNGINAALEKAQTLPTGHVIIRVLPGTYSGAVVIKRDNLSLIAMKTNSVEVNATASLGSTKSITDWPVRINSSGDGITANGGRKNIIVRGFYVTKAGANGIHFYGSNTAVSDPVLNYKFARLCENITIEGNKVEAAIMDGIKVHQCHKIYVRGNLITRFSQVNNDPAEKELEQGIDFVAVGNSVIKENRVLAGGIGMTAKAGSINVTIEGNEFIGPFKWKGITAGEPSGLNFSFYSSRLKYQSKNFLVRNNTIASGILFLSCQNCSAITNKLTSGSVTVDQRANGEKSANICVSSSGPVTNVVPGLTVKSSACPTTFASATVVNLGGDVGYDMR